MFAMDFVSGFPRTSSGYDAIWVIVDRLTKTAHFLPINKTYSTDRLARLYVSRIVYLHEVPMSIVSDRGAIFTSIFWQELHKALGTRLDFSTAFHPQSDGQSKRDHSDFGGYASDMCDGIWRSMGYTLAID